MEKIALSFTLVWLRLGLLLAQPYAVDASLQVQAPITSYLEDLTQAVPSPLQLRLILNDDEELAYPIRLRFSIHGQGISIRSRTDFFPSPILLDYGIPIQLTGSDLMDYFLPENLEFQGIDAVQLSQSGGRLPEGIYNICVEVLDYQRFQGAPLSNQSCRVVEMAELPPPQILAPYGAVDPLQAQNLLIQWVPQHSGNFPTQYTLRLWEIRPGLTTTQVRQQTLPIFEQPIGPSTTFLYGLDAPSLQPGTSYLIQVQVEDLLERHYFTNDGYSEPVQFTYGSSTSSTPETPPDDPCQVSLQLTQAQAPDFTLHWTRLSSAETYVLSLAKDSLFQDLLPGFEVFSTIDTFYRLQGLPEHGRAYIQVQALSNECPPITSNSVSVFLGEGCLPLPNEELAYACGTATDPTSPSNSTVLIQELQIEDTLHAHDFQVIVQEIQGIGRFTGEGYVSIPYLEQARVNVAFSNIEVDEYCRMVSGKMEVTGAGLAVISEDLGTTIDSLLNALEILEAGLAEVESILEDAADFLGELEDIEEYLIKGQNVLENLLHLEEHYPYLPPDAIKAIEDALDCLKAAQNAAEFEDCKAQMLAAIDKLKAALEALYRADYRVTFAALDHQQFGFDTIRHPTQSDLYSKIPVAGTDYWVPWQSVPSQGTATVKATAPSQSPFPEAIQFKNQLQQEIPHTDSPLPKSRRLQLNGSRHQQTETIYALQPYQDSLAQEQVHIAGQLSVISYDPVPLRVVLVPVNGTQYPFEVDTLKARLQSIFSQAIVHIELQSHPGLNIPAFDNLLDSVPSGFLANYNDEMQLIRNRFKSDNPIEEDTYYLFLVEDSEHPQKLGYMPQKKPFGFIYHDNQGSEQQYIKTIAHELAHGAFRLDHSFHNFPSLPPGETDNLMDYALGTHLQKYQWDLIHNPAANWTLFDGDEEGEYVTANKKLIEKLEEYTTEGHLYFLNNLGQVIGLPLDSLQEIVFATGGEMYQTTNRLVPIGSLTFFRMTGDTARYRNCINGQYYNDQRTSQCIGQTYNFSSNIPENVRPLLIRPCRRKGKDALQIVAIDNYTPPTGNNLTYDFALPYFYAPELIAEGKIWHISISDGTYYSLSDEFQKQAYTDFIQTHPELAEYDQISSFYLPGLAYLMGSLPEFYESCVNVTGINPFAKLLKPISIDKHDVNAFSQLKKISDLAKRINALPNPDESVQKLYTNLLGGLLASEFFDAYYDAEQEVYNVFDFLINRKSLVDTYQRQIDKLENDEEADIHDFKQLFQFTDTQLYPCEFEQLSISYPIVKKLLAVALEMDRYDPPASFGYPIYAEHPVLSINDADFLVKLLTRIKSPNCADFLHYLEHTKLEGGKVLLLELLEEISPNYLGLFQNSDFANVFKEINRIYGCALGEVDNIYAATYNEMLLAFQNAEQEDENYCNADKIAKASSYVIPYNYEYLLNRILTLATPYPELIALTDVGLKEDPIGLEIKQKTVVHGIINATNEQKKIFSPFSPVIVDKSSTYGVANDFLKGNHLRLCPAIVYHYFNETAITQTIGDGIFTALDLITLPLPIPTKINAVGRTLAQLDKASSAISIAATLGQGTESLPNAVKQILNLTSAALGIASLSGEAATTLAKWQKAMHVANDGSPPIEALYKPQIQHFDDGGDIALFRDLVNTINGTSSSSIDQIPIDTRAALAQMIKNHGRKFEGDINQNTIDRVVAKLLQDLPVDLIKIPWTEVKHLLNGLPDADWISLLDRLEDQRKIYFRQRTDGSGYDLFYTQAGGAPDGVSIATIDKTGNVTLKDNIADEVFDASEMVEVTTERALYCRGGTCEMVNGACFMAGTLVHTKEGLVPIEDIEVQDQVWAYHAERNQPMLSKVLHRFKKTWHRFCQIITPGDTLLATNKHPFYIPALQRYIPADSLRKGMQVLSLAGTLLTIQAATMVDTVATVYNFEVADQHNYYVGKRGMLVHNDYWSCHFDEVGLTEEIFDEVDLKDVLRIRLDQDLSKVAYVREFFQVSEGKTQDLVQRLRAWIILKELPEEVQEVPKNLEKLYFKSSYIDKPLDRIIAELNSGWEVLESFNDPLSLSVKTKVENLQVIHEYLEEYPLRIEEFKSRFSETPNKQKYIRELLGPGPSGQYVMHRVRGLFEELVVNDDLGGQLIDEGTRYSITTHVQAAPPGTKSGVYSRSYSPSTHEFEMEEAYRHEAPKFLQSDGTPLIHGKGIPTHMYITLRQMKIMDIPPKSIRRLRMSTIVNKETILWLAATIKENRLQSYVEVGDLILSSPQKVTGYAIQTMKQAGYRAVSAKIVDSAGYIQPRTLGELMNISSLKITPEDLIEYGLEPHNITFMEFDIVIDLTPF